MRWLAGSGAKNRPASRAAALTARFGTPGSTTAILARASIERMRRSRAVETTIASAHAIVPPERPVPAPRGTIFAPSARAARTTSATSSVVPGRTTAEGGRRSNPASYSHTRRSSGRQKTFSSPHISSKRRTSGDGAATRGGTGERVAREPPTGRVTRSSVLTRSSGPVGERATPTQGAGAPDREAGQDPARRDGSQA